MPSNQQRRDAERLRLQRQLEQRRERELARRRTTLVVSIVATLALLGGVLAVIAVFAGSGSAGNPRPVAAGPQSSSTPTSTAPTPTPQQPSSNPAPPPAPAPAAPCAKPAAGATVVFDKVTVRGATDLKHAPKVTSNSAATPKALRCRDLVLGTGTRASPTSTITIRYTGVLYRNGKVFDSSWARGQAATFPLARVVPGFRQGIGGGGKVAPMRVGGRRLLIIPPALAYGTQGSGPIPPNAPLVFVVDLLRVRG